MDYSTITIVMFKNVKEKKKDVKYQLDAFYREQETIESESESEVAQSCPTLCNTVDCSPPGPSIHKFSRQEGQMLYCLSHQGSPLKTD